MNGGSTHNGPDEEWQRAADRREAAQPRVGPFPVPGLLRRARRLADLSQRELARRARVSHSTVGRMESGAIVPVLPSFQRMLAAAGLWLVVVDDEGHVVQPMRDIDDTRNAGGWHYPSHLDTILDPRPGEWWGDRYGLARPPETFHRDRKRRDAQRHRSTRSREIWSSYGLGGMAPLDPDELSAESTVSGALSSDGTSPGATLPESDLPEGVRPDGAVPGGVRPDGDRPDGALPDGDRPDGDRPDGTLPEGVRPDDATAGGPSASDGVALSPRSASGRPSDGGPPDAVPLGPDGLRHRPTREWPIGFRRKRKRPARP